MKVLVLGGTAEANALCDRLSAAGVSILLSRAGALRAMPASEHPVRVGGFGGAEGLAETLRRDGFTHVILASHPFASRIAGNAVNAAGVCGLPILRIDRPPWPRERGCLWREFDSFDAIAAALPERSRIFLAIGKRNLDAFASRADLQFVWRSMEPSDTRLRGKEVVGRPAATTEEEVLFLEGHRIDCVVARDSGGTHGYAKIAAAERLGITLFLLRRPSLPQCASVQTVDEAVTWLAGAGRVATGARRSS